MIYGLRPGRGGTDGMRVPGFWSGLEVSFRVSFGGLLGRRQGEFL